MTESSESEPPRWSLLQFAFLCFYSMGFSGMTSFPYYVYRHTGLFLIAFYLLLILVAVPVCYVQIKLGTLYKRGLLGIFSHLVPILKGVAVALLLMTYIRCLTHGLELSYGLYYMFASLRQPFPWSNINSQIGNQTITEPKTIYVLENQEDKFFVDDFLQRSEYIGNSRSIIWYILLFLLATWIFLFFLIARGSSALGKIFYVTTSLVVVCLTVVLVYAYAAVPNASGALYRLFSESVGSHNHGPTDYDENDVISSQLGDPKVWIDALDLHLYSLGLWTGLLPTLGTHLKNKKIVINASWIILLIFYGLLPHIILIALAPYIDPRQNQGWLASAKGIKPGLSFLFVAIPHTFAQLQLSPLVAFLLYLAYFLLGLHHLSLHILMIWENILPAIPKSVMIFFRRQSFLFAVFCFLSFLLSVPYASQCGIFLYMVIRFYMDRLLFALIIFSMVPFIIGYIRQESLRLPIERLSMSLWYGLASLIPACLLIYYFAVYVYLEAVVGYDQRWAEYIGWCASISPIIFGFILGAVHALWKESGTLQERFFQALRTGQLPEDTNDDEYTSVETGDTALQHRAKSPCWSESSVKSPCRSESLVKSPCESDFLVKSSCESESVVKPSCESEVPEKSEVEVSIKPPENGDVARV